MPSFNVTQPDTTSLRLERLTLLLTKLVPVPADWLGNKKELPSTPSNLTPLPCDSYTQLIEAWSEALRWRQGLEDILVVMLAIVLSTDQVGDQQLFLQVIGAPGGAKTRFCDALTVSSHCHRLEHLTGFHSGSGEGYSLLNRINKKTLITPEADVMMSSPRFTELMSQQRRIFDGSSTATFKNRTSDDTFTNLRTPWIMAGTPTIAASNQAHLGDRFLRVWVDVPGEDEQKAILHHVALTAWNSVMVSCNGAAKSILGPELEKAYRLTGGYVDYLRANAETLLSQVKSSVEEQETVTQRCETLAAFIAEFRARPEPTRPYEVKDELTSKELPTRLTHQLVRLGLCIAAATQCTTVDADVLRLLKLVAMDTSRGDVLNAAQCLYERGRFTGASLQHLASYLHKSAASTKTLLNFLCKNEVLETFSYTSIEARGERVSVHYRLTPRLTDLYREVIEGS